MTLPQYNVIDGPSEGGEDRMFCNTVKIIGIAVLALGLGVFLASVLPAGILVILLGLLVLLMGYLLFSL
jgi:hypothetical protein